MIDSPLTSLQIWYSGEVSSDVMGSLLASYGKLANKNVANYASDEDLQSTVTSQGEHVFQVRTNVLPFAATLAFRTSLLVLLVLEGGILTILNVEQ